MLTRSCPEGTGIVAAITGFVAERRGLITEAAQFVNEHSRARVGYLTNQPRTFGVTVGYRF